MSTAANVAGVLRTAAANAGNLERQNQERTAADPNASETSATDVWRHTAEGLTQPMGLGDALLDRTPAGALLGAARGLAAAPPATPPPAIPAAMEGAWKNMTQQIGQVASADGALQTVGAVFGALTAVEQLLSTPLSAIPFPAFPAVRVMDLDVGLPHAHSHPPNLVPPAPPVPLPSTGPIIPIPFLSGANQTLINGMPAARCGDMGLGIWCGGYFPMYEVFLGSSNVWIEGSRAARVGVDITKHCVFTTPKPSDPPMGPMVGFTITSSPNVLIGGVPMPSLVGYAMGKAFQAMFKGLGKVAGAVRRRLGKFRARRPPAHARACTAGEPINPVTGAHVNEFTDFELPSGGCPLRWTRYYDSGRCGEDGPLGRGFRHELQRRLERRPDGWRYLDHEGGCVEFPPGDPGLAGVAADGLLLRRAGDGAVEILEANRPAMRFAFAPGQDAAPLARLEQGAAWAALDYDEQGRLVRVRDSRERTLRFAYADAAHIGEVWLGEPGRPERRVAAYQYDERGCLVRWRDACGAEAAYDYDDAGRMTRWSDRRGYRFHYEFDALGRVVRSRGDDGLYDVRMTYRPAARETTAVYADGAQLTYRYNDQGVLTQIIDPLGGATVFVTDEAGRVLREVDPAGAVTEWLYDGWGGNVGRRGPLGDVRGRIDEQPNPPNPLDYQLPRTHQEWQFGRLLPVGPAPPPTDLHPALRGLPPRIVNDVLGFGPRGRAGERRETAGDGQPQRRCDPMGRVLEEPCAAGVRRWRYDAAGNVVERSGADGATTRYEYDSWSQLRRLIRPDGGVVAYEHTMRQYVTRITDPGGTTSEYLYDLKDRVVGVRRHGRIRERYVYDAAFNLLGKLDEAGRPLLELELGPRNLPAVRRLASGETQQFEYDDRGRITRAATEGMEAAFGYDATGRQTADLRDGMGVEHQFALGRLKETAYFGRFRVRYGYEPDGTVRVTDPTGAEHLIVAAGGLVRCALANGTVELTQFDAEGRCVRKAGVQPGASRTLWSRRYVYSGEGDLLAVEETDGARVQYLYDAARRLAGEVRPNGQTVRFLHDRADNLLAHPGLRDARLGSGNRLAAANGARLEYNDRDHLARRRGGGPETTYEYDSLDRLARCVIDGRLWTASYDPLGRRTEKTWQGRTTRFYWDDWRLAAEIRPDGGVRLYLYPDHAALTPFMMIDYESLDADPASGRRYYAFTNQVGVPLRVENDAGEPVWTGRPDPWAGVRPDADCRIELNLRFPGHYFDPETGLHYNRFRYYSPELGRYLQSDPLGAAGGLNLYAYCVNPLVDVDLDGLAHGKQPGSPPPAKTKAGPNAEAPPGKAAGGVVPDPTAGFKNIDDATKNALAEFAEGKRGASVKNYSIVDKSAKQIDDELTAAGWKKTEQVIQQNPDGTSCTPYRMTFYEHPDGGVVRLKPDGMPDAKYAHMREPHGTKYVKKDPEGGLDFDNEAFKVDEARAIPKHPGEMDIPPGVDPEEHIQQTWKKPSHVPLKKD